MAIPPIQSASPHTQAQPSALPQKQAAAPAGAEDKVTISESAKQALANNAKPAAGK